MLAPEACAPFIAPVEAMTAIEIVSERGTDAPNARPVGAAPAPLVTMPVAAHPKVIPAVRIPVIHRPAIPLPAIEHPRFLPAERVILADLVGRKASGIVKTV